MASDDTDAMHTVLNTPELLESLLLELDQKTLLLSSRVSKLFRDNIAASIKIQRALHFKLTPAIPDPSPETKNRPSANDFFAPYKIKTPEGYTFKIHHDRQDSIDFLFDGPAPTKTKLATGSWRKICVNLGKAKRYVAVLDNMGGIHLPLDKWDKEGWTLGELMDLAVKERSPPLLGFRMV